MLGKYRDGTGSDTLDQKSKCCLSAPLTQYSTSPSPPAETKLPFITVASNAQSSRIWPVKTAGMGTAALSDAGSTAFLRRRAAWAVGRVRRKTRFAGYQSTSALLLAFAGGCQLVVTPRGIARRKTLDRALRRDKILIDGAGNLRTDPRLVRIFVLFADRRPQSLMFC